MIETDNSEESAQPTGTKKSNRENWFPRSRNLSDHSPLFWVENKDRFLRQLLISDIERLTKRRLCVYFCSDFFRTRLTGADVGRLYEIVNTDHCEPFDLMLTTMGGETDATEALISMLLQLNKDFRVIVPSKAKSNGTLICLAARSILMGPTSELGPIEPVLGTRPTSLLMTKEYKEHSFPLYEAGKNAFNQTKKLARQLLHDRLPNTKKADIAKIVDKLCTRTYYFSHGSVINANEARSLGLSVESLEQADETWRRLWLLHNMYVHDSSMWSVGKYFEGRVLSHVIQGDDPLHYGDGNE